MATAEIDTQKFVAQKKFLPEGCWDPFLPPSETTPEDAPFDYLCQVCFRKDQIEFQSGGFRIQIQKGVETLDDAETVGGEVLPCFVVTISRVDYDQSPKILVIDRYGCSLFQIHIGGEITTINPHEPHDQEKWAQEVANFVHQHQR